jgi:hypothetical protein
MHTPPTNWGFDMKTQRRSPAPISSTTQTGSSPELLEQVRLRAYELFEARGGSHGHDLEDWLQAEAEVIRRAKATAAS